MTFAVESVELFGACQQCQVLPWIMPLIFKGMSKYCYCLKPTPCTFDLMNFTRLTNLGNKILSLLSAVHFCRCHSWGGRSSAWTYICVQISGDCCCEAGHLVRVWVCVQSGDRQRQQRRQQCQILARILLEIVQSDFFHYQNEITSSASFFLCSSPWLVCLFSFRYWTGGQLKNTLQKRSIQDLKFWLMLSFTLNVSKAEHIFSH